MRSIPREHPKGQFLVLPFARFPDTKRMQYNTKRHARTRVDPYQRPAKVFLLSPALLTGARAKQLLSPRAQFPAAQSFRSSQGVPIADAFSASITMSAFACVTGEVQARVRGVRAG